MDRPAAWRALAIDLEEERPFRIGGAAVDPMSRDTDLPGGRERLQPQTLKVLVALVRRKGQVVTRSELVDSCWNGRIIGEDVVNRSISLLRDFAERAGGFSIETVPKTGYRLVEIGARRSSRRWLTMASIAALVVALAVGAWLTWTPLKQGKPPTPTIAMLPLHAEVADNDARELASAIQGALSHTLSESGFPVKLVDSAGPGERPADFLVSGEVRRAANSVRAIVRIVETNRRIIVYSHEFSGGGGDVQILPERIGAQVAAALSWTGPLMAMDRRHPSSPAVTADLLRNMTMIVEGGDAMGAYEISRGLVPRAPRSAIAHLSLAFNTAFIIGELPREQREAALVAARRAAERAEALAPEFGDVYVPWCLLRSPTRKIECEDRLRSAMRIDPDAPFVDHFLSKQLGDVGRSREALELARLSIANDRYKLWKIALLLWTLEVQGQTEESDRLFGQGMRWWANHPGLIWNRWEGMLARGDFDAIERFEKGLGPDVLPAKDRTPPQILAAIKGGTVSAARTACAEQPSAPLTCMIGFARLGDLDGAFAIADQSYPRRLGRTPGEEEKLWLDRPFIAPLALLSAPGTAPMRRDPRFLDVAERVGLLRYWRSGRLPDFCRPPGEPVCARLRSAS